MNLQIIVAFCTMPAIASAFLTTPSLLISADIDQTVWYTTLLMAVLLTRNLCRQDIVTYKICKMSAVEIWQLLTNMYVSPRQLIRYGLKIGIPLKYLKQLVFLQTSSESDHHTKAKKHHKDYHHHHLHHRKRHGPHKHNKTITLYRKMPLKSMSRLWGKFNEMDLPVSMRRPLLGLYVWMFGCRLDEAADQELKNYKNLGQFFRRVLKPNVRPVCDKHIMTSPADGRVLHFGEVEDGILEQVKGVTYSLSGFLGPKTWGKDEVDDHSSDEDYHSNLNIKAGHKLYHCIIYLAPGDYHRFHSPTDWTVKYRRHFPGELLSVNPGVARWVQGLFNFNERAVYYGDWKHGFFSFTAVGATNVGSIKIYCDEELSTNTGHHHPEGVFFDKTLADNKEIHVKKGDMFGEFNLGSTIVLIFEAPDDFRFSIENRQKIQFGQPLGTCEAME